METHGKTVGEEEYASLKTAEFSGRAAKPDETLMFARGKELLNLPAFTGGIYLSDVVSEKNEANAPGVHYVVFPKGVYNAWHIHEGGQIIIATDGIGYHQTEGGQVEVLHPGDVAFCPPGAAHWHGGSLAGTFAHIAVNTNPDKRGVQWKDFFGEEDYKKLQYQ